jgi:hypothetical protein
MSRPEPRHVPTTSGGLRVGRGAGCYALRAAVLGLGLTLLAGCGDSPVTPGPIGQPPSGGGQNPPANSVPTIESITVRGTRPNQPPSFADVSESVDVSAVVRDEETAPDQLQYLWTSSFGSFSGTGARVSWQAPPDVQAPTLVTLTLEVIERYGTTFEHRVTRTASVAVHDSVREVGDMARQFLIDFSTTSLQDWRAVMRNFKESACPSSREYEDERDQVENHYTNFRMHDYIVGVASVSRNFGGSCYAGLRGDACVSVPVMWDSTDIRTNDRRMTSGIDHLTAAYSTADSRWWLCSSRFEGASTFGHRFYIR